MPSSTFTTPGWHTFDVPEGVESITLTLRGAGSGTREAGYVSGRLPVNGNQTLHILVGGAGLAASGSTGGSATTGGGGAGGNGSGGLAGGRSGGGASYVRVNSRTGTIRAVAAGAGGSSGDGGTGGSGGAATGENGFPGTAGTGFTGNASGGTQIQGGKGGTSSSGVAYDGKDATNTVLDRGGRGGTATGASHGGGGGGGGYHPGGGGQASANGFTPGGGGSGGANYVGSLVGYTSQRGTGGTGNGAATLTWVSPPPKNQPPSPPTEAKVEGINESDGMATKAVGTATITAKLDDPDAGQRVRMLVRWSTTSDFGEYKQKYSAYVEQGKRATVDIGVQSNTRYYVRLYTQDGKGQHSTNYNSLNFWSNRKPVATLQAPANNSQFDVSLNTTFDWQFSDPDPGSSQRAVELRYRTASTLDAGPGAWQTYHRTTSFDQLTINANTFKANTFYEWTVRVQDGQGLWSDWADVFSFYASGTTSPPRDLRPAKDESVVIDEPHTFTWRFTDPQEGDQQCKADIRYRVVGTADWITLLGDVTTPGTAEQWVLAEETLVPGYHYEWQARTYDGGPACLTLTPSEWSDSATFYTIATPGRLAPVLPIPDRIDVQETLGCGTYQVMIYDRGGKILRGEITPISLLRWNRKRDDISSALIQTNGFGDDCCELLANLRCWMHEIVVFRDGVRVWEGPVARITYRVDSVEIEARDVMNYVYRRIMRQGYNDSYRLMSGEQLGLRTVVDRATLITQNALAPDDPNVLPYLTPMRSSADARQSRVVPDFSRTAWEEIDDLAATAGLDYTVVGRRIIYWDTHRPVGRLPEMRNGDFSDPPIVTEYGMSMGNFFAVTNNNGVWGGVYASMATPTQSNPDHRTDMPEEFYGRVELLASAYGESAAGSDETLTSTAREALAKTMKSQAARNMIGRWPTPVIVRVPDNSALNPEVNINIQHLVPGVWIPLRSSATCREVSQIQKLDSMSVESTDDGERVMVVMSPAPDGERDPDAEQAIEEADD